MFFPRLRRSAKWVFVFLALVFGLGFVVFGVGSDVQSGIGDIFRNAGSTDTGPSVEEARDQVRERPNDPLAQRELSTALQNEGRVEEAIAPLQKYVDKRPRDEEALRELAGLYSTKAARLSQEVQLAQLESQQASLGSALVPGLTLSTGQPVVTNPVTDALTARANEKLTRAYTAAQTAATQAVQTYRRLAAIAPNDASVQADLAQTAQSAGDLATAISAYERFLKLAPDDPSAGIIRDQLKLLRQAQQASGTPTASG